MIWHSMIWYDTLWCNMKWYDIVWYDMLTGRKGSRGGMESVINLQGVHNLNIRNSWNKIVEIVGDTVCVETVL